MHEVFHQFPFVEELTCIMHGEFQLLIRRAKLAPPVSILRLFLLDPLQSCSLPSFARHRRKFQLFNYIKTPKQTHNWLHRLNWTAHHSWKCRQTSCHLLLPASSCSAAPDSDFTTNELRGGTVNSVFRVLGNTLPPAKKKFRKLKAL